MQYNRTATVVLIYGCLLMASNSHLMNSQEPAIVQQKVLSPFTYELNKTSNNLKKISTFLPINYLFQYDILCQYTYSLRQPVLTENISSFSTLLEHPLLFIYKLYYSFYFQRLQFSMNSQYYSLAQNHDNHSTSDIAIQPLDLNFMNFKKDKSVKKDKKIRNALSDRKNDQSHNHSLHYQEQTKTDRVALLQKKKNYSAAIRERNLLLKSNKKEKSKSGTKSIKSNNSIKNALKEIKQNIESGVHVPKKKMSVGEKVKTGTKIRNKSWKNHTLSVSALDLQPIPHIDNETREPPIQYTQEDSLEITQYKLIDQSHNFSNKSSSRALVLVPKTINFKYSDISHFSRNRVGIQNQLKSINSVLSKQNAGFRRQLSQAKEQNTRLQKQLQEAQQYIEELKTKAEQILEQSIGITRLSLTSRNRISEDQNRNSEQILDYKKYELENVNMLESVEGPKESNQTIEYYEDLIYDLKTKLKEAEMLNSGLELKALMSEKKIIEQTNIYRKKVAKEISMWRERCAQLRSTNMKLKSQREAQFSMEISMDQDE